MYANFVPVSDAGGRQCLCHFLLASSQIGRCLWRRLAAGVLQRQAATTRHNNIFQFPFSATSLLQLLTTFSAFRSSTTAFFAWRDQNKYTCFAPTMWTDRKWPFTRKTLSRLPFAKQDVYVQLQEPIVTVLTFTKIMKLYKKKRLGAIDSQATLPPYTETVKMLKKMVLGLLIHYNF